MARKKKRNIKMKDAEVPLSAMIDVVFLLLIYFIVSQKPVVEDTHLAVDLPAPGASKKTNEKPPSLLKIDVAKLANKSDEYYHVNDSPYHIKDLEVYLKDIAETDRDTTIIINCDPNAKHKKLIKLLDMCAQFGLTKLNLVNDESVYFQPDK